MMTSGDQKPEACCLVGAPCAGAQLYLQVHAIHEQSRTLHGVSVALQGKCEGRLSCYRRALAV